MTLTNKSGIFDLGKFDLARFDTYNYELTKTGKGYLNFVLQETKSGNSRIKVSLTETKTGNCTIKITGLHETKSGTGRLLKSYTETKSGTSRLLVSFDDLKTGTSRIKIEGYTETKSGTGRISIPRQSTKTGISRLFKTKSITKTGTSRLKVSLEGLKTGNATLEFGFKQLQSPLIAKDNIFYSTATITLDGTNLNDCLIFLSNNAGNTWEQVDNSIKHTFTSVSNEGIKYKLRSTGAVTINTIKVRYK